MTYHLQEWGGRYWSTIGSYESVDEAMDRAARIAQKISPPKAAGGLTAHQRLRREICLRHNWVELESCRCKAAFPAPDKRFGDHMRYQIVDDAEMPAWQQ